MSRCPTSASPIPLVGAVRRRGARLRGRHASRSTAPTQLPVPSPVVRNRYNRYMDSLTTLQDAELTARMKSLRREQLRRAGKGRLCVQCGVEFFARAGARFCSGRCRVAAFRERRRAVDTHAVGPK